MKIVIIANFPSILDGTPKGRFTNLAMLLYNRGHEVELICSDFIHERKIFRDSLENKYPFKITFLHETGYERNISFKRIWSHIIWGRNVWKYLQKSKLSPDVIYAALPTFSAARHAANYCKRTGAKFVVDVQDIWPEAFIVAFKNPILQLCFKPVEWYVNKAYESADYVIGVSDTYRDRGLRVNKKCKTGLTVYLGNNAALFDNYRDDNKVVKPTSEFWLCYIGTMGYSYDLKCAIDAIRKVGERGNVQKKVKLIAMGQGPLLDEFRKYAEKACIDYEFTGALPYSEMVGKMCSCDATINCINPGAAQSITNKVGDYALSGLPVINTQENLEYRKLVENYHCGINCDCGNSDQVADAIEFLIKTPQEGLKMGKNARTLGVERFDRGTSYNKIVEVIENVVK